MPSSPRRSKRSQVPGPTRQRAVQDGLKSVQVFRPEGAAVNSPGRQPSSLHTTQEVLVYQGVASIVIRSSSIDATPSIPRTSCISHLGSPRDVCNDEGVAQGWTMPLLWGEEKTAPQ